jgi:hypothetical protein
VSSVTVEGSVLSVVVGGEEAPVRPKETFTILKEDGMVPVERKKKLASGRMETGRKLNCEGGGRKAGKNSLAC